MTGMTLEQLEGVVWGEPTFESSLVTTCYRLRTKPVNEFSIEDLRIMIGQQISLPHLIPLAVAAVERTPLAHGDFYPGDLLASLIHAREWLQANPEWLVRVIRVTERALAELDLEEIESRKCFVDFLVRVRD